MGKEAFLKDLRAWQNNLSALFSPLIPKKCHPAYIVKRQFQFLVKLYFSNKKENIIHSMTLNSFSRKNL